MSPFRAINNEPKTGGRCGRFSAVSRIIFIGKLELWCVGSKAEIASETSKV